MTGFSNIGKASGFAGVAPGPGESDGDLTGSYPNPLVRGLWDHDIDPRDPQEGDSLIFTGGEWVPTPSPAAVTYFQGPWNANTNTPDIANYPGLTDGYVWIVTDPGNTLLGGIGDWHLGDYALYSNGSWYKLSNNAFGWGLAGNSGTQANINFVGTTDDEDFVVRTNDEEVLRVYTGTGARLSGSLTTTGNVTVSGGTLSTTSSTFNLLNTVASVINFACSATTLKIGKSSGTNVISGSTKLPQGLSGSLTQLVDGTSYLIADKGMIILSCSSGAVKLAVNDSVFATLSGSVFSGPVNFNAGLSGSLTKLVDGTSAFVAGTGILVSSASNGAVTITMSNTGSAGTYGSVSQIPVFSTDPQGRVSSVTNTSVQISEAQVTNLLADLTASYNSVTSLSSSLASEKANKVTTISAGVGLVGGGDLSANRTISLGNTGSAGTYGTVSQIPVFSTDPQGRVTAVTNTPISMDANQITSGILSVSRGGTGLGTTPTNGQLLIGNGTGFTESTITPGTGILISNGAGSITPSINDSVVATVSGSTFLGSVKFNAGLTGSLTKLADGTSYILGATNTLVTTGSNGSITVSTPAAGLDTQVQFNDGGTLFGANSGLTYNKATNSLTVSGNEAINGGNLTTTASTFNLLNTTATTVNFAGGASAATNIGNTSAVNTFSGTTKFPQGLSGSLTKLTDGTSAFIAGQNIAITSASNGPVTVAFSTGTPAATGNILLYDGTSWGPSNVIDTLQVSYQTVRAQGAIAAGDVCYIVNAGGSNAYPTVAKAQANSLATCTGVIGLATGSIAANTLGTVQTYGQLPGPVATNNFAQGAPLYVSPTTAGAVTDVKPSGPNIAFQIGFVTRQGQPQNVTTGIVFVSPMQETNTQNIHDLVLTSQAEHDLLTYEASTLQWKNKQRLWVPNTQTTFKVSAAPNNIITVAAITNVVYLPIETQGGANVTLNATTPIASLTKTAVDYGRELWLHNLDNNRNISIPSGGNVKLETAALVGGNLVLAPNAFVKFVWTGIGGNGSWVQTSKVLIVA